MLVWSKCPLPMIENLIQSIMEFQYATGLDCNMGCLSMPLDELSKIKLAIIMPYGFFECQVLPQGVKLAMDIFKGQMTSLFSHLRSNSSKIYLDDVLYTSGNSFDDHIKYLNTQGSQEGRYASKCKKEYLISQFLGYSLCLPATKVFS